MLEIRVTGYNKCSTFNIKWNAYLCFERVSLVCKVVILFGVKTIEGVLSAEGAVILDSILEATTSDK